MRAEHCALGLHALWGLRAAGMVGGRLRGGWPATVVRGVWCQALSLPRPPVLWSEQPGFGDPCVPGAVGAGMGTQHRPHSVRPCEPALLAVGTAEGHPRGGCLRMLRGASEVRRSPSPDCPPTGWAVGVRHPRAVGAGAWVWGPNTVPLACMPCGGCVPRGWGGAVPGGSPATVVRGVWCQALSLQRPPVLWSGRPGFRDPCVPDAVGAAVGTERSREKKKEENRTRPKKPTITMPARMMTKKIWIKYWRQSRSGSAYPPLSLMPVPMMRSRTSPRRI